MNSFPRRCLALLIPLGLALPACQRPEDPPQPAHLLPKEKMVPLLADLHVLEARVETSRLPPDSARALFLTEQKTLFWQQEVTDSAFRRSYRYYGIHGKDLDGIYAAVIDTLKQRAAKLKPLDKAALPPPPISPALPANAAALAK